MTGLSCLAGSAALGATAFLYEQWCRYQDAKTYSPPGDFVDLGGYSLHVQVQGDAREGVPTVVVETGIFDSSYSWSLVQEQVGEFAQIVTYDRAGYGWSDPSPHPRSFDQISNELKAVLEAKKVKPPYIFVGHSLGGPLVRHYYGHHPEEIAGLILVDVLHDEAPKMGRIFMAVARALSYLSILGIPRLLYTWMPSFSSNVDWTAKKQDEYVRTHFVKPWALRTCLDEADQLEEGLAQLTKAKVSREEIPVTIIVRDPNLSMRPGISEKGKEKERLDLERSHEAQRKTFPNARWVEAKGSGHFVQLDRPDLVIEEISRSLSAYLDGNER